MTQRRVVLVTGSTDGIGRATARALAAGGMKVILHGRTKLKVDAALAALTEELPGAEIEGISFDLGSQTAVRRGAEQILARVPRCTWWSTTPGSSPTSPRLEASATGAPSRVINVSSIAHTRGRIHLDDLTLANGWTGYAAYAMSKLASVMHAISLADKHEPSALVAYAVHPGVIQTKLLRQGFGPVAGATPEVGARTQVRLAGEEAVTAPSGSYFSEGVQTQPAPAARDTAMRAALWDAALRLARL
ncbi:MAG: SDR family NAD(P)-dependent oxidoreductase [Deltaproteobacteria bacterium]|nr:MAG: SDR family NAD(P)-dependent oxidoreductase [Deltaproteobacteria bacterium]